MEKSPCPKRARGQEQKKGHPQQATFFQGLVSLFLLAAVSETNGLR